MIRFERLATNFVIALMLLFRCMSVPAQEDCNFSKIHLELNCGGEVLTLVVEPVSDVIVFNFFFIPMYYSYLR